MHPTWSCAVWDIRHAIAATCSPAGVILLARTSDAVRATGCSDHVSIRIQEEDARLEAKRPGATARARQPLPRARRHDGLRQNGCGPALGHDPRAAVRRC